MEEIQPIKILMVEDDQQIAEFVCQGLSEAGFAVDVARTGTEGLERALAAPYGAMIVDIMLPGLDGLELLQRLRSQGLTTPILILSARRSINDRVKGFEIGADDYLIKPFAFAELLARIMSLLRRNQGSQEPVRLKVGDLRLDLLTRSAFRDEEPIELQPQEFSLLEYMMRNSGRILTKSEILQHVWGYNFHPSTNVVEVHICRLREKIERADRPKLLKTIRGAGYMLSDDGA